MPQGPWLISGWLGGSRDRTKGAPTAGSTTLRHQVSGSNTSCPGRGRLIFALRCLSSGVFPPFSDYHPISNPFSPTLAIAPLSSPTCKRMWRGRASCGPSLSCIGEGNGNPLQCSCLENPRDGGPWWAAISGVAQSRTWLKRLMSFYQELLFTTQTVRKLARDFSGAGLKSSCCSRISLFRDLPTAWSLGPLLSRGHSGPGSWCSADACLPVGAGRGMFLWQFTSSKKNRLALRVSIHGL